jgi:glycosyltransferase involved in cell wall biosynthesis
VKVAVDAHMIGERETGNERYTLRLIAGLARVGGDSCYEVLVTDPEPLQKILALPPNFHTRSVWPKNNVLRLAWAMPWACFESGVDVLHVSYTAPLWSACPTVVTVHDLSYERYPSFFSPRDRMLLSTTVPLSCRRAARVIAISESTKHDLVELYGIPSEKISVIYEAADERFLLPISGDHVNAVRTRYAREMRYVLALGNIQPRKNIGRLIDAFATCIMEGVVSQDLLLVIAGQAKWRGSDIVRKVKDRCLEDRVVFTGYVPEEDLPALYKGAEVFVFPSIYEGFGLPPLEAMACGTPVVCSSSSSLPEVVGGAARMFDPFDTRSLVEALRAVIGNTRVQRSLQEAGNRRVAAFSWDRAARQTEQVYRAACGLGAVD